jgi:hypothetical protein
MTRERKTSGLIIFFAIVVELAIVVLSTCWALVVGSLAWVFSRRRRREARQAQALMRGWSVQDLRDEL